MKVLHVLAAFHPSTAYGGPVVSAFQLVRAQAALGAEVEVMTTDADGGRRVALREVQFDGVFIRYYRAVPLNSYGVALGLFRALRREVARFDVVHCHGTMLPSTTVALWAAARQGVPAVVSPRGSMMRWARGRHWLRKKLYSPLDEARLRNALLHATSSAEAEDLKAAGFKRVVTVPNGVEWAFFGEPAGSNPRARFGLRESDKVVAWAGRFDPVKNLEALLDATCGLGVRLVLAGDHSGAYGSALRERLEKAGRKDVMFVGHLDEESKRALFQAADVYAHPSFMESYGMSIAEALACGCPVVASRGTPWSELDQAGAGRWVEATATAFREALEDVLATGTPALRVAARTLAEGHAWPERATELLRAYASARGVAP